MGSAKYIIILFILLLFIGTVQAYPPEQWDELLSEPYSGVGTGYNNTLKNNDFTKAYYQKFVTGNITLSVDWLTIHWGTTFTTNGPDRAMRFGITEGNSTEPHLTPQQYYAAGERQSLGRSGHV